VHDTPLGLELIEERRPRIRRQNVKRRALEAILLDSLDGPLEHVGLVVIEP
jgi:hypothetical protein